MRSAIERDRRPGGFAIAYRISSSSSGDRVLIRIEGALDGDGVAALRRECRAAATSVKLDLSDLKSVDRDGVETLRSLVAEGAELSGASPYVLRLLEEGVQ